MLSFEEREGEEVLEKAKLLKKNLAILLAISGQPDIQISPEKLKANRQILLGVQERQKSF